MRNLAAMALASIAATMSITPTAIDQQVARGLDDFAEGHGTSHNRPSGFRVLLTCKPLPIFAASTGDLSLCRCRDAAAGRTESSHWSIATSAPR